MKIMMMKELCAKEQIKKLVWTHEVKKLRMLDEEEEEEEDGDESNR